MSSPTALRPLDPTPKRPDEPVALPHHRLTVEIDVRCAHLANPVLAIARLLASEAQLFAHVSGDDERIVVAVALPDDTAVSRENAAAWIRWGVHNAGVRGTLRIVGATDGSE